MTKSSGLASLVRLFNSQIAMNMTTLKALTSVISETNVSAFPRAWYSLKHLIGMALKHHLINGVYSVALLTGNVTENERNEKQRGRK